jgi:hypothetical protein
MKCKDIRDLMGPYLYGDLSLEEMRAVRTHAQLCEACREDISTQGMLIGSLGNRAPELTDDERQRIMWSVKGAVRAQERERSIFGFRFPPAYALAAAVIIGMVAIKVADTISTRDVAKTRPGISSDVTAKEVQSPKPANHEGKDGEDRTGTEATALNGTGGQGQPEDGLFKIIEGADNFRRMWPIGALVDRGRQDRPPTMIPPGLSDSVVNPLENPDVRMDSDKGETRLPKPSGANDARLTGYEGSEENRSE